MFPGMLLTYFLNDFEIVPVAPIITGITFRNRGDWDYFKVIQKLSLLLLLSYHYYYHLRRRRRHPPHSHFLVHSSVAGSQNSTGLLDQALLIHSSAKIFPTIRHQLWGTAPNSNLEILERFQSKVLRIITDAPWFIPNTVIKHDLQVPTIKQEARKYSVNYRKRLDVHPNSLANALFQDQLRHCRLMRLYPGDLAANG